MEKDIQIKFMGQIETYSMKDVKVNLQLTWETLYKIKSALICMIQESKDQDLIRRSCRILDALDEIHETSFNLHQSAK